MWPVPEPPGEVWSHGAELCQGRSAVWASPAPPGAQEALGTSTCFLDEDAGPGDAAGIGSSAGGGCRQGSPWSPLRLGSSHRRP